VTRFVGLPRPLPRPLSSAEPYREAHEGQRSRSDRSAWRPDRRSKP
jgi:hypothetical protein